MGRGGKGEGIGVGGRNWGGRSIRVGCTLLQVLLCELKPLCRKGSPQSVHNLNAFNDEVSCSWAPDAWHFHSSKIDLRTCSPNFASDRKHVPQAVHVKGRRGVGSWEG